MNKHKHCSADDTNQSQTLGIVRQHTKTWLKNIVVESYVTTTLYVFIIISEHAVCLYITRVRVSTTASL